MAENLQIAATGFVGDSGSVASANGVLLNGLLGQGNLVDFFCKPQFVDPRQAIGSNVLLERLSVCDCTNGWQDRLRQRMTRSNQSLWARFWSSFDAKTYNQLVVKNMASDSSADLDLWLGDWARGRSNRPVVSFAQGPPGTDARSINRHRDEIIELAGHQRYMQLRSYAWWRNLSAIAVLRHSDHVIVGSQWSRSKLTEMSSMDEACVHALPYPVDLEQFRPSSVRRSTNGPLVLLWLGRIVPRKRLDLLLAGMELAVKQGCDVKAIVIGQSGFVPNYERWIQSFPFHDRIEHRISIPRGQVPDLLGQVDVLCQPSDEENFGSSVAEALACGVPAIVGATNGTGDYVCERSIRLADDSPESMAKAITLMADAKKCGDLVDPMPGRRIAEKWFDPKTVSAKLEAILRQAIQQKAG